MIKPKKISYSSAKKADRLERRAANRTGISYGAREAGGASEHFEVGRGTHATRNSQKHTPRKGARRKTHEKRIVSG